MQENRSFDHYFGTFPGARGFNDPPRSGCPPAGRLPAARPGQPRRLPRAVAHVHHHHRRRRRAVAVATTGATSTPPGPGRDGRLAATHIASDGDANGSFTMGYYEQEDIPFHWALAKAFTSATTTTAP